MNATVQFGQLVIATLASAALALGFDWALLCAAFRLMSSAPAQWRAARSVAPVNVRAGLRGATPQKHAA